MNKKTDEKETNRIQHTDRHIAAGIPIRELSRWEEMCIDYDFFPDVWSLCEFAGRMNNNGNQDQYTTKW